MLNPVSETDDRAFLDDGVALTCAAEAGMLAVAMQVLRVQVVSRKAPAIDENRIRLGANVLVNLREVHHAP